MFWFYLLFPSQGSLSDIKKTEYKLRWFNDRLRGSSISLLHILFFVGKIFRFYSKCRWRWMIWYDGRQHENHDPKIVIFCCPWFAVDFRSSSIWSVFSLSKLIGTIFSKLDWQCRYDFSETLGGQKLLALKLILETNWKRWKFSWQIFGFILQTEDL